MKHSHLVCCFFGCRKGKKKKQKQQRTKRAKNAQEQQHNDDMPTKKEKVRSKHTHTHRTRRYCLWFYNYSPEYWVNFTFGRLNIINKRLLIIFVAKNFTLNIRINYFDYALILVSFFLFTPPSIHPVCKSEVKIVHFLIENAKREKEEREREREIKKNEQLEWRWYKVRYTPNHVK